MIATSTDYAIVAHQSGDTYIVRQGGRGGTSWEAYGPLHHTEIPTTVDEAEAILSNQAADSLAEDGDWLWDEHEAGRAHVKA